MAAEHVGHTCPVCGEPSDPEFTPYCSWDCQEIRYDPVAYLEMPLPDEDSPTTEEQKYELYGVRVECPVCDGGKRIPDTGCFRCFGRGLYNVVRVRAKEPA